MINWMEEVEKRQEKLVEDTQSFLQINSILDEETVQEGAPFGKGIYEAYKWFLHLAEEDGFNTKDVEGYAGHIEWGEGKEIVGVLCHLDVVPEGEGWTSPAFAAEIRDGNIYARGALDDKGPTMAAYYALKIVKELGVPLNKKVRLIVGNDEESQWRCVEHYFKREEMPSIGFAPDADFPIIFAEKGICDLTFTMDMGTKDGIVDEFISGQRLNMVPDKAHVTLTGMSEGDLTKSFKAFLQTNQLDGKIQMENGNGHIQLFGKSAHGMEPDKGVNSGLWLAKFLLDTGLLKEEEKKYFSILAKSFLNDSRGKGIGITYKDEEKGDVTINVGRMKYNKNSGGEIGLNLRYPEGADIEVIYKKINKVFSKGAFKGKVINHETPHVVDKGHPLIRTLSRVYEEQTGERAVPIAIGGGTYARSLEAGVAFGPMFPGQKDVAHEADEFIAIEQLKKITAIYAQAIYELAK
ncbi:succinyl-diaminopimelate desuccinylase [Evansella vedderi]|uniref:Succinyl-diaminopimelate desuccinylase n=1 Tax=Evansella vedderi TaxID=38282 RepID=A0ABT9ZUQ7_9BACI|nr:dipeptidase PepV [Evansella vedderi]MDQ0254972.1 succinyl-diaminopimelate desuccinylase [Evansella vedderi]